MRKNEIKKVLLLAKSIPQYRIEFLNQLKEKLFKNQIELELIYGKLEDNKNDALNIPWATYRDNKVLSLGKYNLLWQPALDRAKKSDLIIVEQANSLAVNYVLMGMKKFFNFKLAFWGHGANLQEKGDNLKNKFKYLFLTKSDHWFGYTNSVKRFLISKNVPSKDITVVNNAIDTKTLRLQYQNCSQESVSKTKAELNIVSENIAVYTGALYDIKKIDFLLSSAVKIQEKIKDFNLIVVGNGPDRYLVEEAVKTYPFIHYVGSKFAEEKVVYFKIASIFMLPGAVGLAILDAFATETPMVTSNIPLHGPEIEYLEHQYNGLITDFELNAYSTEVIALLQNKDQLEKLKEGCLNSLEKYTTENMVENFVIGILKCLEK